MKKGLSKLMRKIDGGLDLRAGIDWKWVAIDAAVFGLAAGLYSYGNQRMGFCEGVNAVLSDELDKYIKED